MFALSNRPFRNAGLAFYGLGSLASLGMISDQASAQTVASNDKAAYLAAKCDHLYSKPPEHAGCYAQEALNWERARGVAAERRGAEADRRGAEADKRGAAADDHADCYRFLTAGVKGGTIDKAEAYRRGGGDVSDANVCPIAISFGHRRRADAAPAPHIR